MQYEQFHISFQRMLDNRCSPEELRALMDFMEQSKHQLLVQQWIHDHYASFEEVPVRDEALQYRLKQRLDDILSPPRKTFRWGWVAAAVLLLAVGGAYFFNVPRTAIRQQIVDVAPGTNKAILTLADGRRITLDSAASREIGEGIRQAGSQLQYEGSSSVSMNILTTPRGGQFQVRLPDGTRVWLNAASELKYPTAFNGKERTVTVNGEAYFEVAQDATRPFRVRIEGRAEVEVLGTSFNISAYENETQLQTTLLDGAVKCNGILLKPGQQAQLEGSTLKVADNVDISRVVAWKNGFFNFDGVGVAQLMRQLERWYDIEVVYENGIPDIHFFGKLSRDKSLAGVIKVLEESEVHFRIEKEGRKLIITQ